MKSLVILVLSFCLLGCLSKDFSIIEATSQKWVGGAPGSGKGVNYIITVVSGKDNEKLGIDKIWIGNEYYDIAALKNPNKKNEVKFNKGDTLFIKIHQYTRTNMLGDVIKKEVNEENKVPHEYDGDALLGYTIKGKRKYKVLKEFTKLKFIPYP